MPKRAVMMSFELWKQWMTQGFQTEGLKCVRGIPENAVLVQTFFNEYGTVATPELVAVFNSPDFDPANPKDHTVTCPDGSTIPEEDVQFESQSWREHYSSIKWQEGDRERKISLRGMGNIQILFNWQPENAVGHERWVEDPECNREIPWLC